MPGGDNVIPFPGGVSRDDALRFLLGMGGHSPFARRQPRLLRKRSTRARFTVRVDLDHAKPPIWRRLQLASDLTLDQLHGIVQIAMGWSDSHLHHFIMGPGSLDHQVEPFLTDFDRDEGEDGKPEADVRLDQVLGKPKDRLYYEYDFGDGWRHTIRLEKIEPWTDGDQLARCTAGARACPPEDVGGIPGFYEMLAILAGDTEGMDAEWVADRLEWMEGEFDPEEFSVDEVNGLLESPEPPPLDEWRQEATDLIAQTNGATLADLLGLIGRAADRGLEPTEEQVESLTHRYRHLLRTVGSGVTLTAAGYLPPKIVDQLYRDLEMDDEWVGKGNREDMTAPVLYLRTTATALGLLRKARGELTVTATGAKLIDDPAALLRHIASRVPLGKPHEKEAGLVALLIAAAGDDPYEQRDAVAHILAAIGWRVDRGDFARAAYQWTQPTLDVLKGLTGWRNSEQSDLAARALLRRP